MFALFTTKCWQNGKKHTKHLKEDKESLEKGQTNPTPAKYKNEFRVVKRSRFVSVSKRTIKSRTKRTIAFFKGNAKFPKFKNKHHKQSYTTNVVNGNIKLLDGHIKLPKLQMIKMKQHRPIPLESVIKSCTISMMASGKYYISILTEYEKETEMKEIQTVIGLDFAMNGLFVDSETGEKANYPRYYHQILEKLTGGATKALS